MCIVCFLLQYRRDIMKIEKQFKTIFSSYSRNRKFRKSWKMLRRLFEKSFHSEKMDGSSCGNMVLTDCCILLNVIKIKFLKLDINLNCSEFFFSLYQFFSHRLCIHYFFCCLAMSRKMTLVARHILGFLLNF